jgi:hypothetical protein
MMTETTSGEVDHWIAPSGAPASVAVAASSFAASRDAFLAPRCGEKIAGFRVFMQRSVFSTVVLTGFVTGVMPRTGPRGRASSVIPACSSSRRTPTVRRFRISSQTA